VDDASEILRKHSRIYLSLTGGDCAASAWWARRRSACSAVNGVSGRRTRERFRKNLWRDISKRSIGVAFIRGSSTARPAHATSRQTLFSRVAPETAKATHCGDGISLTEYHDDVAADVFGHCGTGPA
jgi:hypothetical protein